MERRAEEWSSWYADTFPTWTPSQHLVHNTHCSGPICYTTSLLLLLPDDVSGQLGAFDNIDGSESMESYLDDSNMRYSNYISGVGVNGYNTSGLSIVDKPAFD